MSTHNNRMFFSKPGLFTGIGGVDGFLLYNDDEIFHHDEKCRIVEMDILYKNPLTCPK